MPRVTPNRSPRVPKRTPRTPRSNKFGIASLLRSTPRSRKTRIARRVMEQIKSKGQTEAREPPVSPPRESSVVPEPVDSPVDWFQKMVEVVQTNSNLEHKIMTDPSGTIKWLEVTPLNCHIDKNLGPVKTVRLVVSSTAKTYKIDVLYPIPRCVERLKGVVTDDYQGVLDLIHENGVYVLCPGLQPAWYEEKYKTAGYQRATIREFQHPVKRYESVDCQLWHKPCNRFATMGDHVYNVCANCKQESRRALENSERSSAVDKAVKDARRNPSSKYPIAKLSPKSQSVKVERLKKENKVNRAKVEKLLEKTRVPLASDQDAQMDELFSHIQSNTAARAQLDAVLSETGDPKSRAVLEGVWKEVSKDRQQFFEDQRRCVNGRRGNRWSTVSYRIALAVYARSPAAFEAVKSLNILQLPCKASLQSIISSHSQKPGVSLHYLCDQRKRYTEHCDQQCQLGKPKPVGEGVLIFDEVKVQNGVCWNTKTNRIVGLAMTHNDLVTLGDVYEELNTDSAKKTTYVLQFLWRDVSSDFDLIGPYFTSSDGLDSKFTLACLFETMQSLESVGFKVKGLICDGASWNLCMIKKLCQEATDGMVSSESESEHSDSEDSGPEHSGSEQSGSEHSGSEESGSDDEEDAGVQPPCFFVNPFSAEKCYIVICPSHELKSLVSALDSSKSGRSKSFCYKGVTFGWNTIQRMWEREIDRAKRGQMCEVPRLAERHINRDAWTRLNVLPAKIMQQDKVLAEIEHYGAPHSESDKMTLKYLTALNNIFERGVLSREHITATNHSVLDRMETGYTFFTKWRKDVIKKGINVRDTKQSAFLAWQTWDLLTMMYSGFRGLCFDFVQRHSQHYVVPIRINGSAIESLFSRFKFGANGNLSAVNYETAMARLLTTNHLSHESKNTLSDYRNTELHVKGHLK